MACRVASVAAKRAAKAKGHAHAVAIVVAVALPGLNSFHARGPGPCCSGHEGRLPPGPLHLHNRQQVGVLG